MSDFATSWPSEAHTRTSCVQGRSPQKGHYLRNADQGTSPMGLPIGFKTYRLFCGTLTFVEHTLVALSLEKRQLSQITPVFAQCFDFGYLDQPLVGDAPGRVAPRLNYMILSFI